MTYKLITEDEAQLAIKRIVEAIDTLTPMHSDILCECAHCEAVYGLILTVNALRAVVKREGPACHGSYQHRETGAHVTVYTLPDESTP